MNTILLLGLTHRTSFSAARTLLAQGNRVAVSDTVTDGEKTGLVLQLEKTIPSGGDAAVLNFLGRQDPGILDEIQPDMVVPSPGVPLSVPIVAEARKRKIPVVGDIELFYRNFTKIQYVGVTGTDGKTTTATLVHEMFKTERYAQLGGNVGIPVFDYYSEIRPESVMVLELSSFQLESIERFRAQIAAVLNVAQDHLDRYDSVKSYLAAKKRIFLNQTEDDFAVLNLDDPHYNELKKGLRSRALTFSRKSPRADCYLDKGTVTLFGEPYLNRDEILLKGVHNAENAMAAILMAKSGGITDASIKKVLSEFAGLEHRLEFVRTLDGVDYYNDSKSTTVNALEKALESFDRPVHLIAGGRDKGLDFRAIRSLAKKKLKTLVLIGEAAEKIGRETGFQPAVRAADMADAVATARQKAASGDVVLLSPGCASFDMFKNYEERGRVFKEAVNGL